MNHFGTSGRKEKRLMKREVKEELEGENLVCVGGERERKGGRGGKRGVGRRSALVSRASLGGSPV